ncbi:MAG: hypothetical protein Q8879_00475, partial [Candidatus Phytoplasma australasiaticum]|nr:hypothetical protein [Candidatus Phytoplasma australasiaticum]
DDDGPPPGAPDPMHWPPRDTTLQEGEQEDIALEEELARHAPPNNHPTHPPNTKKHTHNKNKKHNTHKQNITNTRNKKKTQRVE